MSIINIININVIIMVNLIPEMTNSKWQWPVIVTVQSQWEEYSDEIQWPSDEKAMSVVMCVSM